MELVRLDRELGRHYRLPDDRVVPSVSTVLDAWHAPVLDAWHAPALDR